MTSNSTLTTALPNDTAAIDTESLYTRCGGNISFALALLTEMESKGDRQVDSIAECVAAGQCAQAAEQAHSLKGAAGILGAERLRSVAAEIESAGKENELATIVSLVDDLQQEMRRCLAQIPEIRAQTSSAAAPADCQTTC